MPAQKQHYPTFIDNPTTGDRVIVQTPYHHHRQLLAWKLPGLEPVPEAPKAPGSDQPKPEPGYPRMIENPADPTQRAAVYSKAEHDAKLAFWTAKQPASTTRKPLPPPPPPRPQKPPVKGGKAKPTQPPTKEDFMKLNYPESIAQKMADEEIRKYNAGEAPYDGKG